MATVDHMVSRALGATLSPDAATRGEAELYLKKCERTAGFPALLLDLARRPVLVFASRRTFRGA